jgi:hypothetical protein
MGGTGCCFTPAEIHQQQPALFGSALALLAARGGSDELTEAAVQLILLLFGPERFSGDEAEDFPATAALARALLDCRPRLAEPGSSYTLAAGVAKLAAAITERCPDFVCGEMPEVSTCAQTVGCRSG